MKRRQGSAGVTLLELLVAITLVSLLFVGIFMAMRIGLNAMDKTNTRMLSNRRVAGSQRVLERQIASLMAVVADCQVGSPRARRRVPFFQGEPESMRFVSAYSMAEGFRGYPRILEYQVIPGERNEGVRLVVNERMYTGPLSAGMLCLAARPEYVPIEVGPQSFVLADRLAYCRFGYLEQRTPDPKDATWRGVWSSPNYPLAIRVEMAPLEPDPSRLPLLSLTVPLRVNKDPMVAYADTPTVP